MAFTRQPGRDAYYEDQALSASAPSADTDGMPLDGLDAFTVVVEANSTKTLSGGSIVFYMYDDLTAAWFRCTELDWTIAPTSVRRSAVNYTVAGTRRGTRVCPVTSSVTVSGGTTVRVYFLGGRARGQ